MPLKCVETIYHPSQRDEEIVHPLEKSWDKVHHEYYHRDGHRVSHTAEPAPRHSVCLHLDRRSDVYREGRRLRPETISGYNPENERGTLREITKTFSVPLLMEC